MKARLASYALMATLGLCTPLARAQSPEACGSLQNHYGPMDFRLTTPAGRALVENAHFTSGVETLTRGMTGPFGGDIAYTLRVYPNHPRALQAMERLVEKEKANPPKDGKLTIECYYERALRYQPDDHVVRLLFANFLLKRSKQEEARTHVDYVVATTLDNPFAQFNAGLLYTDMKDFEKALVQAHRVIAMGFNRRELRERLMAVGRWVEPAAPAEAASAAASAPASAAAQ